MSTICGQRKRQMELEGYFAFIDPHYHIVWRNLRRSPVLFQSVQRPPFAASAAIMRSAISRLVGILTVRVGRVLFNPPSRNRAAD
jgi:hypothetical protein